VRALLRRADGAAVAGDGSAEIRTRLRGDPAPGDARAAAPLEEAAPGLRHLDGRPVPRRRPGRVHPARVRRDAADAEAPVPGADQALGADGGDERADYQGRIGHLRQTGAAVRWLSLEPLLGPIDPLDLDGVDWVVLGGESGPGARPFEADWARSIRDQCRRAASRSSSSSGAAGAGNAEDLCSTGWSGDRCPNGPLTLKLRLRVRNRTTAEGAGSSSRAAADRQPHAQACGRRSGPCGRRQRLVARRRRWALPCSSRRQRRLWDIRSSSFMAGAVMGSAYASALESSSTLRARICSSSCA